MLLYTLGGAMLRPTDEEKEEARQLGIEYENMNGPQIREAIKLAKARLSGRQPRNEYLGKPPLQAARDYAHWLRLSVPPRAGLQYLRTAVAKKLDEMLKAKGVEEEKRLRIIPHSSQGGGYIVRVAHASVRWVGIYPSISLYHERNRNPGSYNAYYLLKENDIEIVE